jgi:FkbM family methyltransferase
MQETKINGKYTLMLPEHRAARPEWKIENGGWEVERIEAMINRIAVFQDRKQRQPIVFDIGTEEGDITALLAKYTKCDMVLFEPNELVWSCMKHIWEINNLPKPLAFFSGFICNADKDGSHAVWDYIESELNPEHGFKQLYESDPSIPQSKLDTWCEQHNLYPDIITMDVEGSEFEVLKGAEDVLLRHKPVVFMSIHPVFMKEHYNQEVGVMLRYMHDLGYSHQVIELDYHELHVMFEPKG